MRFPTVCLFVLLILSFSDGKYFELEVEDFLDETDPEKFKISQRPTASHGSAVWMVEGAQIIMEFCLSKESDFSISEVIISNDGGEDSVSILLDWDEIATYTTLNKGMGGMGWNDYRSTGRVGIDTRVSAGRHTLVLNVTSSDSYGVEIDKIQVFVSDEELENEVFMCRVFCFDHNKNAHVTGRGLIRSARAEQMSSTTECAEVNNIKIPFYHQSATKLLLKASYPEYTAFLNNRRPDFSNCETTLDTLWRFSDYTYSNTDKTKKRINKAVLGISKTETYDVILIVFSLRGPRFGSVDSEIGSILKFAVKETLEEPIDIGIQYIGRNKDYSAPTFKTVAPESLEHEIRIPDFSWTEGPKNALRLLLPLNTDRIIEFESISLRKRPVTEDLAFKLYDNSNLVMEGIDVDFWWQGGKKMRVKILDTGYEYDNADYLRFYERVPWSKTKEAKTFEIYQDGIVRLLPIPPYGVDEIPFGSSVLIGESIPARPRPSANIEHLDVDLKRRELKVYYDNNNTVSMKLRSSFSETILTVYDIKFKNRQNLPFATFMSMWVENGNSDVDHVSANGNKARRILSDWKTLFGTSFAFYRKCLSTHNTLSPDIQLEIMGHQFSRNMRIP